MCDDPFPNQNPKTKPGRLLLWFILLTGAVLVTAVLAFCYFVLSRPVGLGPTGPSVPREAFGNPWTTRKVYLVGLGDSVTAGFGARKGYSYFDLLVTNAADEWPDMKGISLSAVVPNLRTTNLAVSGSTSFEHVERQLPRLPTFDTNTYGLIVMTTGGNDLIHNYGRTPPRPNAMYGASWEQAQPWIADFERRLEGMIEQIDQRFPGGCQIFLANIYDPTDGQGDVEHAGLPAWPEGLRILDAYNRIIRRVIERHPSLHEINLHESFLGHGIHCTQFWRDHYRTEDPHYWYNINLEDPNERGYDAIRRLFLIEIAKTARQL
jgi:lysophospholipase L1-like esterase